MHQNGIYYELRGVQYYPCLLLPEPKHCIMTCGKLLLSNSANSFCATVSLGFLYTKSDQQLAPLAEKIDIFSLS